MYFDDALHGQFDIKRLLGRRVLVLGDAIVDEYVQGDAQRLSPEAPVPVLRVENTRQVLGGAANTAANVVSLGGRATLICVAHGDAAGDSLRLLAERAEIAYRPIDAGVPTLRKIRVVGQRQQIVRLDYEERFDLSNAMETAVKNEFDRCIDAADVVVISDYAKGIVTPTVARHVLESSRAKGRPVIVDPRPQHRDRYHRCDFMTPNWREARALLSWPEAPATETDVAATARALTQEFDSNVLLTLGAHGMRFCSRTQDVEFSVRALAREVYDVSGAGDTVVATLALAVAAGLPPNVAAALANRAASVAVGKLGTATVSFVEITADAVDPRLLSRSDLAMQADLLRKQGKQIVTINGSFDLLHRGHVHILREARRQGDVLIVGLNSDASVRRYKGSNRPVVGEADRAEMLLALRMVDYVHLFDEDDPRAFLAEVRPDVHVNGAEYGTDCIEADVVRAHGGRLHLVPRLPGFSSSDIIRTASRTS